MPDLADSILLVEDDHIFKSKTDFLWEFDRNLQSVLQVSGAEHIRALLIGRFESGSGITMADVIQVIDTKRELKHIPVLANLDFGHTTPCATFPIGGVVEVIADETNPRIIVKQG